MPRAKADDHASRINYLFQAAQLAAPKCTVINQYYGNVLNVISEKTAAKRDFTMKRFMCKQCKGILVPGVNMRYRLKKRKHRKSRPVMNVTCLSCQKIKRLPTQPEKKLNAELYAVCSTSQSKPTTTKS